MGRLLIAAILLTPLLEIALFILIGNAIGLWPTLLGVLVMALAGVLILRFQGLSIVNNIRSAVGRRELPARALGDGMFKGLAGMLLIIPGYFTGLIGLLLLLPPVRSAIYALLASRVTVIATAGMSRPAPAEEEQRVIDLDSDDYRQR